MSVERAVERALRERSDLATQARDGVPTAWGRLAAHGVLVFRDLAQRRPSDEERRAIWAGLWRAVSATRPHNVPDGHDIG